MTIYSAFGNKGSDDAPANKPVVTVGSSDTPGSLVMLVELTMKDRSAAPTADYSRARFMADLKRASAKVKPGRKMERDEAIRDVVNTLGDALKNIRD